MLARMQVKRKMKPLLLGLALFVLALIVSGAVFYAAPQVSKESVQLLDMKKWMEQKKSVVYPKRLNELTLPGTHDSATSYLKLERQPGGELLDVNKKAATYAKTGVNGVQEHVPGGSYAIDQVQGGYDFTEENVPGASYIVDQVQSGFEKAMAKVLPAIGWLWAKCHRKGVDAQLNAGVRYLDIRAGLSDIWRVHHSLVGAPIAQQLERVRTFLNDNKGEVVLIEVSHLRGENLNHDKVQDLVDIIEDELGDLLYPSQPRYPTVQEMVDKNRRVLLSLSHGLAKSNDLLWISVFENSYANSDKTSTLKKYNDRQMRYFRSKSNWGLFKISWTLTPDINTMSKGYASYIVSIFGWNPNPKSMVELAKKANKELWKWMLSYVESLPPNELLFGNVLLFDDYQSVNIRSIVNVLYDSDWNTYANGYDEVLYVKPLKPISSVASTFDRHRNDRRFRFQVHSGNWEVDQSSFSWTLFSPFDENIRIECEPDKVVMGWYSRHDNGREDRRMKLLCGRVANKVQTQCQWTADVNSWEWDFTMNCPSDKMLTGVYSNYNNHFEDRRFRFKCCGLRHAPKNTLPLVKSPWTGYQNSYDDELVFQTPNGAAICGFSARFAGKQRDRQFRFKTCTTASKKWLWWNWAHRRQDVGYSSYDRWQSQHCGGGKALTMVNSLHDNHREDRIWKIGCHSFVGTTFDLCMWTDYVNYWKEDFDFECGDGYVFAGMRSTHNGRNEDRRFNFKCCRMNVAVSQKTTTSDAPLTVSKSSWTRYQNRLDQPLIYTPPTNKGICGVSSYHVGRQEDRVFRFKPCKANGVNLLKSLEFMGFSAFDGTQKHMCAGSRRVLTHVESYHNNHREDRQWLTGCDSLSNARTGFCHTTSWVNAFDGTFKFECPVNEMIAGMYSEHNNHREDRRFKFKCCSLRKASTQTAKAISRISVSSWTGYQNYWDKELFYTAPRNTAICGIRTSQFSDYRNDRRFRFKTCTAASGARKIGSREYIGYSKYDKEQMQMCGANRVLVEVKSEHKNQREDRKWMIGCDKFKDATLGRCYLANNVNNWELKLNFQCRSGYVITGMQSTHSNSHEDRRFGFKCCEWKVKTQPKAKPKAVVSRKIKTNSWTSYQNWWDSRLYYTAPSNHAICGVSSYHDNGREDRRFRFKTCRPTPGASTRGSRQYIGYSGFDRDQNHYCGRNRVLTHVRSYHSNRREDRQWKIGCSLFNGGTTDRCYDSGYVNYWDRSFDFRCKSDYVIAGMRSTHSNSREDRRFRFKCCRWTFA